MIAARERRPYEIDDRVAPGELVIITLEADETWGRGDPAAAARMQAMLDDLARAADRQTAMIRAGFARIATAADALAVRLHSRTLAAAIKTVRIRAAAYWAWLRELLRSISSCQEPADPTRMAYLDLKFLVASAHGPEEAYKRPGAKEAHERAREAPLLRWAERIAAGWRVRPRERSTMRRVAHLLSQRRHDIAVLLGIDVVVVARPTREEEEATYLTAEEKTARLEAAYARLTGPAARLTGTEGIVDPYDRLQPYRAGDGDGDGAGHTATKIALLQDGALVLALGDVRKPLVDVRWLRRIPKGVRKLAAARGVEVCALHLPRKDVLAWVQAQAIKKAEHDARALVYGGNEHVSAADRSRYTHSLDALMDEAQAGQEGHRDQEGSRPRLLGDASRRWARRDLGALAHDWERERREEDAAAAKAKSQAIRAALNAASADADLTPGARALLDAVRRTGGDRAAAAAMLELTAAAERTAWHRLTQQLVPKLRLVLAALPA